MKLFLKVLLSLFIILVLTIGGGFFFITRGLEAGRNLKIEDLSLVSLNDGTYNGEYNAGRWTNEVEVTVKDQRITKIDIVKDVLIPNPEVTKELLDKVVAKQETNVDVVSGATVTCKAYLKSIENALKE
ncbi:MAG: FMN-binding protein [Bacillota bacterium]